MTPTGWAPRSSGSPLALASALAKIAGGVPHIPNQDAERHPATAPLFIINPLSGHGMDNLFSTHPATENRIAALQALARAMGRPPSVRGRPLLAPRPAPIRGVVAPRSPPGRPLGLSGWTRSRPQPIARRKGSGRAAVCLGGRRRGAEAPRAARRRDGRPRRARRALRAAGRGPRAGDRRRRPSVASAPSGRRLRDALDQGLPTDQRLLSPPRHRRRADPVPRRAGPCRRRHRRAARSGRPRAAARGRA